MSTYSASDFIGKTIWITDSVPIYAYATKQGDAKPKPKKIAKQGDSFVVDSFISKNGYYSNYDDYYWLTTEGGAISFTDIAGKYNYQALADQGLKSDKQKAQEEADKNKGTVDKITDIFKKYGPWVIGGVAAVIVLPPLLKKITS